MATDQRSLARGVEYLSSWLSYRRPRKRHRLHGGRI